MDLAASVQKVTEDVVVKLAKNIAKETGRTYAFKALNCVVMVYCFVKTFLKIYGFNPCDAGCAWSGFINMVFVL